MDWLGSKADRDFRRIDAQLPDAGKAGGFAKVASAV